MINDWLFILAIIIFALFAWPLLFLGAPFLPSFRKKSDIDLKSILSIINKHKAKKVIDLGSGDGRVVSMFAEAGFKSYGVEINPLLAWWSKRKIRKLKNAHIYWRNFWNMDLSEFDVVFMFQFKVANRLLADKLQKELRDGSLVISAGFPLEKFKFIKKVGSFWIYKK